MQPSKNRSAAMPCDVATPWNGNHPVPEWANQGFLEWEKHILSFFGFSCEKIENRKNKISANDAGNNLDVVSIASSAIHKLVVMLYSRFTDRAERAFCLKIGNRVTVIRATASRFPSNRGIFRSLVGPAQRRKGGREVQWKCMLLTASQSILLRNEHCSMSVLLGIYDTSVATE